MKMKAMLAVFSLVACGSLSAQNAAKVDLNSLANQVNALSAKVAKLESDLNRVITENVNLVEQLNIKKITSATDANNIQWDIVKVYVDPSTNNIILDLRITNHSAQKHDFGIGFVMGTAVDSNSNLGNNVYNVKRVNPRSSLNNVQPNVPVNYQVVIEDVPITCTYLATINLKYTSYNNHEEAGIRFTGVHVSR